MSSLSEQASISGRTASTPVWWPLRAWLGVEVLFGVGASLAVFVDPTNNPTNFAWPVKPDVMVATLGAFYLASLFTLVPSMFIREWQRVRVIVLPGAIFTGILLIATVMHWDRFSTTITPFYIWLASYVLPPPVFAAMYWWHQSRSRPVGADVAHPMSGALRAFLLINGLAITTIAILAFMMPAILLTIVPWTFTPLTVRAFCGFLALVGLFQLSMAWENDVVRARIAAPMLIAFPFALAIQLFRFSGQVTWSNVALWFFIADIVAAAIVGFIVWQRASTAAKAG